MKFRKVLDSTVQATWFGTILAGMLMWLPAAAPALAQSGWSTGVQITPQQPAERQTPGRAAPRADAGSSGTNQASALMLEAYLSGDPDTTNRPPIDRGLVWRIYTLGGQDESAKLVRTLREPTPTVQLPPGRYAINAAFGRAYLTEMVDVTGGNQKKKFILNAGGLKVLIKVAGDARTANKQARYDIYADERDQSGERRRVLTNVRPGLITRVNSGIYHIVSRLGDANARVSAEVAVEAGKLTEAIVNHEAATVTFKLVQRAAGEALADTQWIIMTKSGDIIKESAGALPSHVLAPGSYNVSARWGGKLFTRSFEVISGQTVEVEVLMQ